MSTFGNSSVAFDNYEFTGVNLDNDVAAALAAIPVQGDVTSLSVYFGGDGAAVTARLAVWNSAQAILAYTPSFTAPGYSRSVGGQGWQTVALSSPLRLAAGQQVYIGFWRKPSGSCLFSFQSGVSSFLMKTDTNTNNPGSLSGAASSTGKIAAYATYTPVTTPTGSRVWVTASAIKISYPA